MINTETLDICKTHRETDKNGELKTYYLIEDLENYLLKRKGLKEFNYLVSFLELTVHYAFFTQGSDVYIVGERLSQIKYKSPLFEKLKRECLLFDNYHDISYYELVGKLVINFCNLEIKKFVILDNYFIDLIIESERIAIININNVHDLIEKTNYLNEKGYTIYEIGRYENSTLEYLLLLKLITRKLRHDYDMTA